MEDSIVNIGYWIGYAIGSNLIWILCAVILIGVFWTQLRKRRQRENKPDTKRGKGYWK